MWSGYCSHGITNAVAEGTNSKIMAIKRPVGGRGSFGIQLEPFDTSIKADRILTERLRGQLPILFRVENPFCSDNLNA